jgi:hypothetical protein
MSLVITVLAASVAAAAAARSTWSPCGLSMLSTITPVGERGKGHRYGVTATWFVMGALGGGATVGAMLAVLTMATGRLSATPDVLGLVALGAALVAAASDAGVAGVRVPIHRRQVNERWLDRYRPWVYAAGFGWQIGTGLATYVTTVAVYLMMVLAVLTGRPLVALSVGAGFGLVRGLAVLLTRHLDSPPELIAFHRRFTRRGPAVARVVTGLELASAVVLLIALRTPASFLLVLSFAAIVAVLRFARTDRANRSSARLAQGRDGLGDGRDVGTGSDALALALAPSPPLQRAQPAHQEDGARHGQRDAGPLDEHRPEVAVLPEPEVFVEEALEPPEHHGDPEDDAGRRPGSSHGRSRRFVALRSG